MPVRKKALIDILLKKKQFKDNKMWTEPSPAQELANTIQKAIDESRPTPQTYWDDIEKFNKQGWDKSEEAHNRKKELFEKLRNPNTTPSEGLKIINEINNL